MQHRRSGLPVLTAVLATLCAPTTDAQRTRWELKAPTTSPAGRDTYAMAYDTSRGRAVIFVAGETWEWTGFTWVRSFPSISPKPRTFQAMAYDAARRRVVLFGGHGGGTVYFNDTWQWDGFSWTRATPATSPAPRGKTAMAFDSVRGRVVLFGGGDGLTLWNDTWEWDGSEWIRVVPPQSPAWRESHAMAFDSAQNRTVLFGGDASGNLSDTWVYDGNTWVDVTPRSGPSGRAHHGLAFDTSRNRTVLFGGTALPVQQGLSDTWEWDGTAWRQPIVTGGIAGLYNHAIAYDTFRRRVVLFGGRGDPVSAPRNETWEYSDAVPATYATFGTGCGRNPVLGAEPGSLPWTGTTFRVRVTNLAPTSPTFVILSFSKTSYFGLFPLPFPLDPIGMTGCTLYVRDDVVSTVTNQGGTATLPISIPNDPTTPGTVFFNQAFAIEAGANPLGVIVSNAGEAMVGKQ